MQTLKAKLKETAKLVSDEVDLLIPKGHGLDKKLFEAIRYSLMAGGKRLRPFLVMSSSEIFDVPRKNALRVAAAVEMVHTYSLVHDDLPVMDDDDVRRGKPACHIKYDEATAILVGDSLITLAFDVLSHKDTHKDPEVRCKLIESLAFSSGSKGMVGGQMIDLVAENKKLDLGNITRLQRLKTGELIAFACTTGAILGKATESQYDSLHHFAHDLGLAFQIQDDLLDALGNEKKMGKKAGKDAKIGKATFVSILGITRAKEQADLLVQQAIRHLKNFGNKADWLKKIAHFVVERQN